MATIRNSDLREMSKLAQCHRAAFPGSLSSAMGRKYCTKMLSWYLSTDKAFLFHIEDEGTVAGYCGGIIVDGSLTYGSASSMTQFSFNEALMAFLMRPWLLLHREMRKKYGFALLNLGRRLAPRRKMGSINRSLPEPSVGLVVIGVDPVFQGKGLGSELLRHFEKVVAEKGFSVMRLTVKSNNVKAIEAYKRNGWLEQGVSGDTLSMEKRI